VASCKATDAVYKVEVPPAGKKLRELFYMAHYIHSHIAHFYALAAPDFVCGPDAPPAERNILGVIAKVGIPVGSQVIQARAYAQSIQATLGGKATHPVGGIPGGMSKPLTEAERQEIEEKASSIVEFAKFSLKLFEDVVLKNQGYVDLILSDAFTIKTNYMGLVDHEGKVNFYDGELRVIGPDGTRIVQFAPDDYLDYIAEHPEPWTYLKFPFLKSKGWHGIVDGADSGMYRVAPLARLNVADGMATPLAQAEYERFYSTLGGKPVHQTLATHWARLVEVMYAAERLHELARDAEICSPAVRAIPTAVPSEGVGVVEAPRGTLIHHYKTDDKGIVQKLNIVVATAHNYGAMCLGIKKAAMGVIRKGAEITEGTLNRVEMAFRAYDPCFACATHALPGQMPLELTVRDAEGKVLERVKREVQAKHQTSKCDCT
jgi:F420-non-reducing hydrogenase large subunit